VQAAALSIGYIGLGVARSSRRKVDAVKESDRLILGAGLLGRYDFLQLLEIFFFAGPVVFAPLTNTQSFSLPCRDTLRAHRKNTPFPELY